MGMANMPSTSSPKGRDLMKIEGENEKWVNKTLKSTGGKPTDEGEPGPEAGAPPQQEPCKVVSLAEYRSRRKNSPGTDA
jgi:hypothetical protein